MNINTLTFKPKNFLLNASNKRNQKLKSLKNKIKIDQEKEKKISLFYRLKSDNRYIIDYNKFIEVITRFEADAIIGSRLIYSEYTRSHNILNKFGNMFITLLFNILYNTTFTDIYSCYLCFKKNLLIPDQLTTEGFEQHAEILCKVVKKGNKFYEVPISYNGRTQKEGKKIKFYHIFIVIFRIIIERLK